MKKTIGTTLKDARKAAELTIEDVQRFLVENGTNPALKTIYGWENNFSHPNIHTFLLLCKYYGIKDILETFGYEPIEKRRIIYFQDEEYSNEELDDIERYAEFLKIKHKQ